MTPRQCLFHALDGEPTEQTPVWLLFPYHCTGYYVDVRTHNDYRKVFDLSKAQGVIMLNRRNIGAPMHTREVSHEETLVNKNNSQVRRRMMWYGQNCIYSDQAIGTGNDGKKLLTTDEELEIFCGMPLEEDEAVFETLLEQHLKQYQMERAEFPIDYGAMMLDLGSPVNVLYHSADLGKYSIWSLTHAGLIESWLDRRIRQLEYVYRFCLERDLADVYFLVGSELASPPMVSRQTFQKWVVPHEKRLIALVHSYGKRVIQHYHGQIREVLPDFLEMKPDGLHTIESPPIGNCTLSQAFELTQNKITLIGNIQYDEFRSSTPSQMKQMVFETIDEAAGKRFILSPTAGPYDDSPPACLIDNYIAFMEAAHAYGGKR